MRKLLATFFCLLLCLPAMGQSYSPNTVYTTKTQTLTNKTLTSATLTTPIINGNVKIELGANDDTLIFSVPSGARNITFPDPGGNDSVLYAAATQTLTNKTIGVTQLTGTLGAANGGTGQASYTAGDLLRATAATTLSKLGLGTALQTLRVNAGATDIEWATPAAAGTVTNFSAGDLSPLFTTSEATTTTTPALTFSLSNISQFQFLGRSAVGSGAPSYIQPDFTYFSGAATAGQLPAAVAYINLGNSWSAAQVPNAAGTIDIGSTSLPFRDVYLRGAGANYTRLVTASLNGNRTLTFPNADSNTVIPDTGSANNFLTAISSGGVISKAQPAFSNLSGNATVAQGGTNVTSYTAGDILRATGAATLTKLGLGTALQFLRVNAGATDIEWAAPAGAGNVTGPGSAGDNSITLYDGTSGTLIKAGVALGTSGQVLTSNGAGVPPSFQAPAGGGAPVGASYGVLGLDATLTAERVMVGTSNRITLTDGGANGNLTWDIGTDVVTLTGSQTLTNKVIGVTQISGVLAVAQGGTANGSLGVSALGVYNGDGSKVVQTVGTAGQSWRVNAGGTAVEAYTPVTSVGISGPSIITWSSTPVTSTGTLTGVLANQSANVVLSGPASGSAAAPTFRRPVLLDLPDAFNMSCGGRLSTSSTDPVDKFSTAATTLYYLPYVNNVISLYDGSKWVNRTFSSSIAVPSTRATIYDVYAYDNAGTVTLELTDWDSRTATNNPTAGTSKAISIANTSIFHVGDIVAVSDSAGCSFARIASINANVTITVDVLDTGFTTPKVIVADSFNGLDSRVTALARQDGIIVKSGDATRRYLGSIATSFQATAGKLSSSQQGEVYLWNYYNRVPIQITNDIGAANSWTYATASTWREANAKHYQGTKQLIGVRENTHRHVLFSYAEHSLGTATIATAIGSGANVPVTYNDTSTFTNGASGELAGQMNVHEIATAAESMTLTSYASFSGQMDTSTSGITLTKGGVCITQALEWTSAATATFYGEGNSVGAGPNNAFSSINSSSEF